MKTFKLLKVNFLVSLYKYSFGISRSIVRQRIWAEKWENLLGAVLEVEFFTMIKKEEMVLKVLVELDVTKPLRRMIKIARSYRKVIEIKLKYEKIGNFRHYCGFLGHENRCCNKFLGDTAYVFSEDVLCKFEGFGWGFGCTVKRR
ncbi:hypothetical protein AHAS_Ahas06G0179700 [Arachis hypogaea]